jgi:hypothetical protein
VLRQAKLPCPIWCHFDMSRDLPTNARAAGSRPKGRTAGAAASLRSSGTKKQERSLRETGKTLHKGPVGRDFPVL